MVKRKCLSGDVNVGKKSKNQTIFTHDFEKEAAAIESVFLLKCSNDFFQFYSFCCEISPESPLLVLKKELGFKLVGPFEILADPTIAASGDDLTCCYRYFHDPPELVTVMTSISDNLFHVGYFRDNYSEKPSIMVSSDPSKSGKISILGEDIFSVVVKLFNLKKDTKKPPILTALQKYCAKHSIKIETKSSVKRDIVCKTLNGVGLQINLDGEIGYRPVPMGNQELVDLLNKIVRTNDENAKLQYQAKLDELITLVQFANDEGDYGEGLELGLDLLAFHPTDNLESVQYFNGMITHLLSTGYLLAGRPRFADVIQRHMKNRKMTIIPIGEH